MGMFKEINTIICCNTLARRNKIDHQEICCLKLFAESLRQPMGAPNKGAAHPDWGGGQFGRNRRALKVAYGGPPRTPSMHPWGSNLFSMLIVFGFSNFQSGSLVKSIPSTIARRP